VISLNIPDLVDELALPEVADLEIDWHARDFLTEGKHRGEKYGVTVSLCNTSKVDYKALLADLGVTEEQIAKYTTTGASIRVSSTK
jgi:hypothetical protein